LLFYWHIFCERKISYLFSNLRDLAAKCCNLALIVCDFAAKCREKIFQNHQKKLIFYLFLRKNKKILIKQHISRDFRLLLLIIKSKIKFFKFE